MASKSAPPAVHKEVQELSFLFEVSQILDRSLDLRDVIRPVLSAITKHMGMLRDTITLLNHETGEILIEAAYGLSAKQRERGRTAALGEGVTGKVAQPGKPAVVPHISDEPLLLDRIGARSELDRDDISFICVPVKLGNETIGALSADRLFAKAVSLEEDVRLQESLRDRFQPANIIGNSKAMQVIYGLIVQISGFNTTVLIRDKSGTG